MIHHAVFLYVVNVNMFALLKENFVKVVAFLTCLSSLVMLTD